MATGYTADVADGKVTSFRQFALQCSRAFGAMIMMRDDPIDAPIPSKFEPSTKYHDEALSEARKRRDELLAMKATEIEAAAVAALEGVRKARAERQADKRATADRYRAMLAEVQAWEPPTSEHIEMKTFMADQLQQSIKWDCGDVWPPEPDASEYEPKAWLRKQFEKVDHDINYHTTERAKEIERTNGRNDWLSKLVGSLPAA